VTKFNAASGKKQTFVRRTSRCWHDIKKINGEFLQIE